MTKTKQTQVEPVLLWYSLHIFNLEKIKRRLIFKERIKIKNLKDKLEKGW